MNNFDTVINHILGLQYEQIASINKTLASTMGNPNYSGTTSKPNLAGNNPDPNSTADAGSPNNTATSQFASQSMRAGDENEQLANQFMGTAIGDIEKIVNMRDGTTAAQTVRSVYSQLDPTGAEAMAKAIEQPDFKWDEFRSTLRNKISQLGNVAGSLVGQKTA